MRITNFFIFKKINLQLSERHPLLGQFEKHSLPITASSKTQFAKWLHGAIWTAQHCHHLPKQGLVFMPLSSLDQTTIYSNFLTEYAVKYTSKEVRSLTIKWNEVHYSPRPLFIEWVLINKLTDKAITNHHLTPTS